MLKFVRPERVSDFEATLNRLKEALDRSNLPRRRQQAAGWRVFRAAEASLNGDVVYVFEINPVIPGADYTVATILAEAFPSEAESLYRRYAASHAAPQNIVNLSLIAAFGESPAVDSARGQDHEFVTVLSIFRYGSPTFFIGNQAAVFRLFEHGGRHTPPRYRVFS